MIPKARNIPSRKSLLYEEGSTCKTCASNVDGYCLGRFARGPIRNIREFRLSYGEMGKRAQQYGTRLPSLWLVNENFAARCFHFSPKRVLNIGVRKESEDAAAERNQHHRSGGDGEEE